MQKWRYEAKTKGGKLVEGVLEVEDRALALTLLTRQNLVQINLEEEIGFRDKIAALLDFRKPSPNELYQFFIQLAAFIEAGEGIHTALSEIIPFIQNDSLKESATKIYKDILATVPVDKAFLKQSCFSPEICAMIRAGMIAGEFSKSFNECAEFYIRDGHVEKEVELALRPVKWFAAAIVIVAFIITQFIAPQMQKMAADIGTEIPWFCQIIYSFLGILREYSLVLLAMVCAAYIAFKKWKKAYPAQYSLFLYNLPIYKKLYRNSMMYRMSRVLHFLLKGGVGMSESLECTAHAVDNPLMKKILLGAKYDIVKDGDNITHAIQKNDPKWVMKGIFIPLLHCGDRSGQLEKMLKISAETYKKEWDLSLREFGEDVSNFFITPIVLGLFGVIIILDYPMLTVTMGGIGGL